MGKIESHRDLLVWQKGMDLGSRCTTRASVAVPANIAEGHACGTRRDYAHFVSIARGSLMEVETYVMIVQRLGLVDSKDVANILERITELSRMLTALRRRLIEPRTPNLEPPRNQ